MVILLLLLVILFNHVNSSSLLSSSSASSSSSSAAAAAASRILQDFENHNNYFQVYRLTSTSSSSSSSSSSPSPSSPSPSSPPPSSSSSSPSSTNSISYYLLNFQGELCHIECPNDIQYLIPTAAWSNGMLLANLSTISIEDIKRYPQGKSIAPLNRQNDSPDEVLRTELFLIQSYQKPMLQNLNKICTRCKNPAIHKWKGKSLIWIGEYLDFLGGKDALRFFWVVKTNDHQYEINFNDSIQYGINGSDGTINNGEILNFGIDPRIVEFHDGKLGIAYNYQRFRFIHTRYAEIIRDPQDNVRMLKSFNNLNFSQQWEKNWTPFVYLDEVHFIQSINPLRILKISKEINPHNVTNVKESWVHYEHGDMKIESVKDAVYTHWRYGWLRGGTNALLIDFNTHSIYLSFFHSTAKLLNDGRLETYFMGAYTFSAKPPFTLLALSKLPIVDPRLYDGDWFREARRAVDYVIYPTQIYIENNATIFMTIGWNDVMAYTAELQLEDVLRSLLPL